MIQFFATQKHQYTLQKYIDAWAKECRKEITIHSYEQFSFSRPLPGGVWIFADLERLMPPEMFLIRQLAGRLRQHPEHYLVLNNPVNYLGRFDMLRLRSERGLNDFKVRRLDEPHDDLVFPVFLRSELEHAMMSPLLDTPEELHKAIRRIQRKNRGRKRHFMVAEFCDCRDADGLYRKYSTMNVHGKMITRHILFSKDWVVKSANEMNDALLAEEIQYLEGFPHDAAVREAFQLAGVSYGRIDYSFHRGKLQVWEINTNPYVVLPPETIDSRRLPTQTRSALGIRDALIGLSRSAPDGDGCTLDAPLRLIAKAIQLYSRRWQHRP